MRAAVAAFVGRRLSARPDVQCRGLSFMARYDRYGPPQEVVKLEPLGKLPQPEGCEVLVKFLAAPVNPADINTVEGVYGIKNPLPSTPGNEGVGIVEAVGGSVSSLQVGDWVIPGLAGFGTWRSRALAKEDDLIRVPNDIPVAYAATLAVNPSTAYRMLRDFRKLEPGDVVVQNGANSMVGYCVIQMARLMGLKTVNIIRSDRPQADQMLRLLSNLGGDLNVTDTYVNTPEFNQILRDMGGSKLAFNCVGGEIVTEMARSLDPGCTIVTYGGMSKRPMNIPYDLVTSKQIHLAGFWVTEWYKTNTRLARAVMIADIASMIRSDQLSLFLELHDFDDFQHALAISQQPFSLRKVVLNMSHPDRLEEHDGKRTSDYDVFDTTTV